MTTADTRTLPGVRRSNVLVAIVKKELGIERSLHEILQILSVTLFEKTPIFQALSE